MKQTTNARTEESFFLSLCGEKYTKMILEKSSMTHNDFNRFCYTIIQLELYSFYIDFVHRFNNLYVESQTSLHNAEQYYNRHYNKKDNEYAELDKCSIWLREFWDQIPSESEKLKYKDTFWIDD